MEYYFNFLKKMASQNRKTTRNGQTANFVLYYWKRATAVSQRGDVITVGGFKGTVLSIDLKYVRLASSAADSKAAVVLIPLSVVYKGIIIRHSK